MIPKIIHYVWVGPKALTPLAEQCISSWKKHMPDYEIKLWNESNSPMSHHYVQEMYRQKKWAFVSDYIRFWALEREGGIYLDTDMEVLTSLDDLTKQEVFLGKENDDIVGSAIVGTVPHSLFIQDVLTAYEQDKTYTTERTSPHTITTTLKNNNYKNITVYEQHSFFPCKEGEKCTPEKMKDSYTRHHWAESWVKYAGLRKALRRIGIMPILKKMLGRNI